MGCVGVVCCLCLFGGFLYYLLFLFCELLFLFCELCIFLCVLGDSRGVFVFVFRFFFGEFFVESCGFSIIVVREYVVCLWFFLWLGFVS